MTEISASVVKELRDITGAAIMDCKRALQEVNGDAEKAREVLRLRGQLIATKKSSRKTSEGRIWVGQNEKSIAYLKLACETDFVARNEKFDSLQKELGQALLTYGQDKFSQELTPEGSLTKLIGEKIAETGENILVTDYSCQDKQGLAWGYYVHTNYKLASLAAIKLKAGGQEDLAPILKDLCLHIAANRVEAIDESQIDPELLAKEQDFYEVQAQKTGKLPQIQKQIVANRLKSFKREISLLSQPFLKDPATTVAKWLKEECKKRNLITGQISRFIKLSF